MTGKAVFLLKSAKRSGVHISVNNGELQLKMPKAATIDPQLLQDIRENKAAIIDFLSNDQWKAISAGNGETALKPFDRSAIQHIPLSFGQERLWFIDQLEGSLQYHIPTVLKLTGTLDKSGLAFALQSVVSRHESLRSVVYEEEGEVYQKIMDAKDWELVFVHGDTYAGNQQALDEFIGSIIAKPFNLTADYLLRATLITLQPTEHVLVITIHHIASDGSSVPVIIQEVAELYQSYIQNRTHQLPQPEIQYADYAVWQRNYLQGDVLAKKTGYWQQKLSGVNALQLPADFARPATQSTAGSLVDFTVDKQLADSIKIIGNQQGTTLFMTLLAAFKVLLYRYSNQPDICVGTPVAGRQQEELKNLVGFFVNTLALRTDVGGNDTFTSLLQKVKTTTTEAYENQEIPFEKIVEVVAKERDLSRSPLFQVLFALQNNTDTAALNLPGLSLSPVAQQGNSSKFDISFFVTDTADGFRGTVEYSTALYREPTILRMISHYTTLLRSIVQNPQQAIGLLPLLSLSEEKQLLTEFNNTASHYPSDKTIVDLFELQVTNTPDAIALIFGEQPFSYRQLNEWANHLAHHLRSQGVHQETLVPICLERSAELIIAILAVLKAGCAYVPINPGYPAERISFILEDTKARVVICNKNTKQALPPTAEIIKVDINDNQLFAQPDGATNPQVSILPQHLAYVMYTSGSTGTPKGVLVQHSNVVSLVKGAGYVSFTPNDILLSTGSVSFDATTFEYWGTLLNGGQLVVCPDDVLLDSPLLKKEIVAKGVNTMWFTASWLNQLVDTDIEVFEGLHTIIAGGERLSEKHIGLLRKTYPAIHIINGYGPTENTTFSLTYPIENVAENTSIPIGRPLSNRTALVVDTHGQLQPVGIPGEIWLGGAGLARGYLNQPELTAEKFVNNPYRSGAGARWYKTGDIGRWLADGNMEYLGRIDEQVKINGYRIELGEVESVLQQCPLVESAVVMMKQDENLSKRLVGYVVPQGPYDKEGITTYLKNKLPAYMVPALWVEMAAMPLTPNGKVNRKALPEPDGSDVTANEYVAPQNETEQALAEIWQQLLGARRIGIHDNFFELGGHSLLAMRLVSAIRKKLQVEVDLKALFVHPTIAAFSAHLQATDKALLQPAIQVTTNRPAHIPLSFGQERLWFIHKAQGSLAYHLPSVLRLKGLLDKRMLENALQQIINRHEVLRTIIPEHQGRGYQLVQEKDGWKLDFTDGSRYQNDQEALQQYINGLIQKPFDLSRDYMLRAHLVQLSDMEHVLVVIIHHIAADGWSMSILVKELAATIAALLQSQPVDLAPLPLQYADYAIWQREYLQGDVLLAKQEYWKTKLENLSTLQLPTDYPRPVVQSSAGAQEKFTIEKELTDKLKLLSRQQGTTLFMTLLAGFNIMLQRYSGQQDICVGTPIAGRSQAELELLIGLFINSLALRSDLSDNPSFIGLLQQVKTTTLEAYANAELPFEKVVEIAGNQRDTSRNPLFQVLLSMQNTPEVPELHLGDITLTSEGYALSTSQLDIIWNMTELPDGLQCNIIYCTDLFTGSTIRQMTLHFTQLLEAIVQAPHQRISSFRMLGVQEQQAVMQHSTGAKTDFYRQKTVIHLLEDQVIKTPHHTAIVFKSEQLTYQQLNEKANQLASYLLALGVKKEQLIPVCLERSPEMLIAVLGILKAGAAYVPIDPAYPQERINYLLEDTAATIIITHTNLEARLPEDGIRILTIDGDWEMINTRPTGNIQSLTAPGQLAYIIYTSGSTGRPKGVMVEHSNLISYLRNDKTNYIGDAPSAAGSFIHLSYTFDASLTGLFMPLLFGKTVVISSGQSLDIFEDDNLHKYAPYSFIKITPAHLELLRPKMVLPNGSLLTNKLVIGGEALLQNQLQYLFEEGLEVTIINEYGPTEATVGCSVFSFNTASGAEKTTGTGSMSIGKPIDNTQLYILGANNELLPPGITGELCIAGAGLARGYLNQPVLTAEKFIVNPFDTAGGSKLYKTGDLARWSADGNITYVGRNDEQVKIRGYRVETGEIETVLSECSLVKAAVVVAKDNKDGGKRLIGYVVPVEDFDKEEILAYLQSRLPNYMVPQLWVPLQTLPLTINGKVDRKALPDTDAAVPQTGFTAPRTEMENVLAAIWQELLDVETVGINDNFFELGGDSIIIIQIVSRARRAGYEFQVSDLFTHQTIAALCAAIEQNTAAVIITEQETLTGTAGLLPIQHWYLQSQQQHISYYNQGILLNIDKSITPSQLAQAFETLTDYHDALRFRYVKKNGDWQQEYGANHPALITADLQSATEDSLAGIITEKATGYQSSLDIESGDMVKAVLMQTPGFDPKNRLLVIIHHLAVDGVSWRILLHDLELLLTGFTRGETVALGAKTSSYRQWYATLENYGQKERLLSQQNYWQQATIHYQPLPVDTSETAPVQVKDIEHLNIRLSAEETTRLLQEVPRAYHTEINDLLLAALAQTLSNWSRQEKVVIGMDGHGREPIDLTIDTHRTIGWFTSLYPLLLSVPETNDEAELIKSVKEQLRQLPDKGIGYGVLKYINKDASLQGAEPWDIAFNYLGQLDNAVKESKWLSGAAESAGPSRSNEQLAGEKISINGSVRAGELSFNWSYSSRHYYKATIEKLSADYLLNLQQLIAHCVAQLQAAGPVFTPSDYGLGAEITYAELDQFLAQPYQDKKRSDYIDGLYRLSGLQEGMLFHGLYDVGVGAYVEQVDCTLEDVNIEMLKSSWAQLLKQHSILRTAFYFNEFKVPVQCVYKVAELPVVLLDYRAMDAAGQAAAIKAYDKADRDAGVDFKAAPLMRLTLFRLGEKAYRMLWTSHHILFDGWSFNILITGFLTTYEHLFNGTKQPVKEEDRYEDYIRFIERSDKEDEEQYWRKYLVGIEQSTLLPFISKSAERNKGIGSYQKLHLQFNNDTTLRIQNFAQRHHFTVNTLMQGVWAYLLHQYTGEKNVVYGVVVSGRPDSLSGVEQRVGMYINTLLFHSAMDEQQPITDWLNTIQTNQVASRKYQHTPLHKAQGWSGIQGDLFDTLLTFENYPINKLIGTKQWALNVSGFNVQEYTNYPLSILIGSAAEIDIMFSFNALFLEPGYVAEIKNHFEHVLLQLIESGEGNISKLNLLTAAEQQQLLGDFNKPATPVTDDKTVIQLFEAQVQLKPDATAIIFGEEKLSYSELNSRANQLARHLKSKGVTKNSLIPVFVERSTEMMVSLFGILKTGAAYIPIDPDYPEERIAFMLEDTGATFVITDKTNRVKIPVSAVVEIVEFDNVTLAQYDSDNLNEAISGNELAYIIYTSGSTGKQKGVMVQHKSLTNYLRNGGTNYINETSNTTGSFIHLSYTFDASLTALFMPLITGKMVVISTKQSIDIFEDANLLQYAPYDFIKITPAHLELIQPKFKAYGKNLLAEKLVIGGEALHPGHFDSFIAENINVEIINEYGPTEATVGCTTYSFKTIDNKEKIENGISIGKPIDNAAIYIITNKNQLVPVGIGGEICIGGAGVAKGYLNRKELTAEKFVRNSFSQKPDEWMYKTGDIGRWLPDGNIEYLGRVDDQVKIRGYRVELGEIEAALQTCEEVTGGAVIAKDEKEGGKKLLSYYVPDLTVVKAKETELQFQRVANWKELYETEYGQTENDESIDPEFNIIGWNDSFTGNAIPSADMREWLDDIVHVVLSERPETVVEIGCGTGLIYYQLAGKVGKYIGSDLSRSSINQIKERIGKGQRNYGDTELVTAPAHEVNLAPGQRVDTVLLNSIIQYFPGQDYLDLVIDKCFGLIQNKGRIILGDVRDNRLLPAFRARLRLQKLQDAIPVKEFRWGLEQDILNEEELCISPEYFYSLQSRYPQITHVEIQWKQGNYINELTLYRYTVIIYAGITKPQLLPTWKKWDDGLSSKTLFEQSNEPVLAIKDVPNPRLGKEKILQQALENNRFRTAGELRLAAEKEADSNQALQNLVSSATANGYRTSFLLHPNPFLMNVVFQKNADDVFIQLPAAEYPSVKAVSPTNIPLYTDISYLLQKDIRQTLLKSLPEYMVPAEFFSVKQLPLTTNGKVDRLFLSRREEKLSVNALNYLPPVNELQKTLAEIWKALLHLERVGIEDHFFDIGGHSLLAMRVISAIRKQLQVEVNIKDLFTYPTIDLLAGHIQKIGKGLHFPPIEAKAVRPEHIPLSFSQERLFFIHQLDGSLQYHIPAVLRLKGALDKKALSNALRQILHRHEVLRTIIVQNDGQGYQEVKDGIDWQLYMEDDSLYEEDGPALQHFIAQLVQSPFNLEEDYNLRATLIRLGDGDHILVAVLHHIASDGWSASILVKELTELYNAFTENRPHSLSHLPIQYADFAIWQRTYLQGEAWQKRLNYWREKLDGVAVLQLPADYPRPLVQSTRGAITGFKIGTELTQQLQQLSQQQGATLFMTLLTAFKVLMYRYSGQHDICVGTPVAGRQQHELEGLIGFFVNTLAIRTEVDGGTSFVDLLQQVKVTTLEAYDHQEVPFEKVVELVVKDRDISRSPLFQVMFVLQNTPESGELRLGKLKLSRDGMEAAGQNIAKYDLTFYVAESAGGLHLSVEYCTDLFSAQTISNLSAHFTNLLFSLVHSPGQSIGTLPILADTEKQALVTGTNSQLPPAFSTGKTITALFEEKVQQQPDAIALTFNEETLTYRQLNERANQLAHYLIGKGVTTETLVPVCMKRSIALITSMLAILKAGGAYVPIDPEYPDERISFMLNDIGTAWLLTDGNREGGLPLQVNDEIKNKINGSVDEAINCSNHANREVINVHAITFSPAAVENPDVQIGEQQLVYIIYTSGSTGRPKGVMVQHDGLVNLINWHKWEYNVTENSRATAMAGVGFDAFALEIWPYLCCGASLLLLDDATKLNPAALVQKLLAASITHSFIATALVKDFISESKNKKTNLEYVLTGGDKLPVTDCSGLPYIIANNYGPTESTIITTSYKLTGREQVAPPIGKPIWNATAYLLSEEGELTPPGAIGELCIGGMVLARGYWNRPEVLAEKFIADTFGKAPGKKLYKTGDLCRWLADGNLQYIGRKDNQVQIRGFRIELGEIENVVVQSGLVKEAVVLAADDREANKQLKGYVVVLPEQPFDVAQLTGYLSGRLPVHMVPRLWKVLEKLPLTANGKVDYKALLLTDASEMLSTGYVAPRTKTEEQLVAIWQELLGVERVGVYDNFFELGGHSLMAMRLVSYIEKGLSVSIPVKALFQFTCINDLSKYLELQTGRKQDENKKAYKIVDI